MPVVTKSLESPAPQTEARDIALHTDGTSRSDVVAPAPETLPPAPCFWFTNWKAACQAAVELERPVLLHLYMPYCGPCKRMEETVFPHSSIQALAGLNFVMVKLDGKQFPKLCSQIGITSFPSDVILLPDGKVIAKHSGFQDVQAYSAFLAAAVKQSQRPPMTAPIGPNWKELLELSKTNEVDSNLQMTQALEVPALEPEAALAADGKVASTTPQPEIKSDEAAVDLMTLPNASADSQKTKQNSLPLGQELDLLAMESTPQSPVAEISRDQQVKTEVKENVVVKSESLKPASASEKKPEIKPTSFTFVKYLMDGYCPVSMVEKNEWVRGKENLTAEFEGGQYCFATEVEKEKFEKNPRFYALVSSGFDIVALTEADKKVEGSRRFGIRYGDLNFVFANPENREKFRTNPDFYAAKVYEFAAATSAERTH